MANALYPLGKKKFLDADIDLLTDTIKISLIDTGVYTYSAAHEFHSSLTGVVAEGPALGTKTTTSGVFDSADFVFTAVSGASVEAYVIWKDTGVSGTSPLIAYVDTASGLPLTPNGNDIDFAVNASGHFAI